MRETIPTEHSVFMRIHSTWIRNGEVLAGAYQDRKGSMSVDWELYSTPELTRQRARKPEENGVRAAVVGGILDIEGLSIEHQPIQPGTVDEHGRDISNRAHCGVLGEKTTYRRVMLARVFASWMIRI